VTRRALLILGLAATLGGGGALAARAVGTHPVQITSGSMAPTVKPGEWIVVQDLGHDGRSRVARGDIVMFRFPLGTSGRAIKRVIAVAGDRVALGARSVTVNGRSIRIAGGPSAQATRARAETVPPGKVFLLGDNSAVSIDSRSFGAVPVQEIVARHVFTAGSSRSIPVAALGAIALLAGALMAASAVGMRSRRLRPDRQLPPS
jgi:signal peptidase I